MRRLICAVAAAALSLAWLLGAAGVAAACDCDIPTLQEDFKRSAAVFVGKVVRIEEDRPGITKKVTFTIEKSWKGEPAKTLIVFTPWDGGGCGYDFAEKGQGDPFLVFAHEEKGSPGLWTDICTRTKPLRDAKEDLDGLGEGKAP